MSIQRFASELAINSDSVHLDGAPKVRAVEETLPERVQRAMYGILHPGDAGIGSRSSGGLARRKAVIVAACQEFGWMVSEKKGDCIPHLPETALYTI